MKKLLHISEDALATLCRKWASAGLTATVRNESNIALAQIDPEAVETVNLRLERAYASAKALLFPARERVAVYSASGGSAGVQGEGDVRIVLGVRNCDVSAIALMDRVFLEGDFRDPFYELHRNKLILVSVDCVVDAESCFCNIVGIEPFPTEGFDINLSPIEGGYVVEVGSDRGAELLASAQDLLSNADDGQIAERDANRSSIKAKLVEKNAQYEPSKPINESMQEALDSQAWEQFATLCVECGACTNICPACHCFYMYDRESSETGGKAGQFDRLRSWDSCLFADYARMAGGEAGKPNPRPQIRSRLENRFTHKFLYMVENYDCFGCTGCGRCFDACLGGIDPRNVIKTLQQK